MGCGVLVGVVGGEYDSEGCTICDAGNVGDKGGVGDSDGGVDEGGVNLGEEVLDGGI